MARIVFGTYLVRYPLGGMLSCMLQWILGFARLGHEIYVVEKAGYADACFDPTTGTMSDRCAYGIRVVGDLLTRFGLGDRWCFVDAAGTYHGLPRPQVEGVFRSADVFVDYGSHGSWLAEASSAGARVLIDGEPAYTQMRWENDLSRGIVPPTYDHYFTVGRNVGTPRSTAPTAGRAWRHTFSPVVVDLFAPGLREEGAPFTTVMNWQSHDPVSFGGIEYGQKDVEFAKFVDLPLRTRAPMEMAIAGKAPVQQLQGARWRVRGAHDVTVTYDAFLDYIRSSAGEFSVCKNVFVATNSGWFSDRSAVYLACGRPAVVQDTGFGEHLPCGRGVFAVRTVEEAAEAIDEVRRDAGLHAAAARDIATEYLDAPKVVRRLLGQIGLE